MQNLIAIPVTFVEVRYIIPTQYQYQFVSGPTRSRLSHCHIGLFMLLYSLTEEAAGEREDYLLGYIYTTTGITSFKTSPSVLSLTSKFCDGSIFLSFELTNQCPLSTHTYLQVQKLRPSGI